MTVGFVAAGTAAPVGGGGYLRVRQEHPKGSGKYRIVRVHETKLTPAQLAAAKRNGLNTAAPDPAQPAPAAPAPAAPTPATPTPPPPPQIIDPRDGSYQSELARYAYDRDRSIAEINAERTRLPSLYNRGAADIRTAYNRDRYDSNANLAARGIIRSGEYQRRGADRQITQVRQTADLDRQYGSGAQSALTARLNDINTQYNLNSQSALQNARDRYASNNPASTYIWANTQ